MLNYQISIDTHNHLYNVKMVFKPTNTSHELKLPTWIPGSYMIREFSKNIVELNATQKAQNVLCNQINKNTWELTKLKLTAEVTIEYTVYAYDFGIRAAYLDDFRGYFNNTSLCLYVVGLEKLQHNMELINLPKSWNVATGLKALNKAHFVAESYDELIDCPVEIGNLTSLEFVVKEASRHKIPDYIPNEIKELIRECW